MSEGKFTSSSLFRKDSFGLDVVFLAAERHLSVVLNVYLVVHLFFLLLLCIKGNVDNVDECAFAGLNFPANEATALFGLS